jgi:hypothetical protein
MQNLLFLNKPLKAENVFPNVEVLGLSELTGKPSRRGLERAILVDNTVMNIVSNQYGVLKNEDFFPKVSERLDDYKFEYDVQSRNFGNGSFVMDFILTGENYAFKMKSENGAKIRPFLSFTNSYDGSAKTSGHFGFFREVCSNGLHVATSKIGFSIKHRGKMTEVVMPSLEKLVFDFMNNEWFEITRNFEILSDRKVNTNEALKQLVDGAKLWKWESSEKNPNPSLNSRLAIDIVNRESRQLGIEPNLWLVYNALNEVVHGKLKMPIAKQEATDKKIFEMALEMAN